MKLKKVLITIGSLAVTGGVVAGGIFAYKNYQRENTIAGILPVTDISWEYEGDEATSYGMLTNDAAQEIYLDDTAKVETVYVKQGDTIAVGDALLKYDTSEVEAEIKTKELELESIKNELEKAKHELEVLRKTTPVNKERPQIDTSFWGEEETEEPETEDIEWEEEDTEIVDELPEKDEKDERIYNYLTDEAVPYNVETANGSMENPYIYYVNKDAYVYGSFYNSIRPYEEEPGKNVVIVICKKDENGKMAFRSEEKINEILERMGNIEDLSEEELEERHLLEEELRLPLVDDASDNHTIYLSGDTLPTEYDDDRRWYLFSGIEVEENSLGEWMEEWQEEVEEIEEWEEPEGYSEKELAAAITEKEKEVKKIDIDRRTLELTLNSLKEVTEEGIVYAKVDGFVKSVADLNTSISDGDVFMVVTKDAGLYVSGTVSELLLDRVKPGTTVIANSWETGITFDAVVTEVSDYPTGGSDWSEGNPNVSYYQYTAFVEDTSELKNGEYVDLLIPSEAEDGLFIEKAYVRQENGQSYVMIADENERLKKQYVITGKTIYDGEAVEIKAGLSEDDMIAFPYGEGAVEGANTTEDFEMYY